MLVLRCVKGYPSARPGQVGWWGGANVGKRGSGRTDEIELVSGNQADTGCATRDFFFVLGV